MTWHADCIIICFLWGTRGIYDFFIKNKKFLKMRNNEKYKEIFFLEKLVKKKKKIGKIKNNDKNMEKLIKMKKFWEKLIYF